tara:strand:- start:802 stop:1632 length:831 start_codon:yes stop_codon:yes gene_type:complete
MKTLLSRFNLFFIVILNTFKYNLWKATIRKIFAQIKSEKVSDNALLWYKTSAIEMSHYAYENNLLLDENIISDQIKNIIKEREEENSLFEKHDVTPKRNRMGGFANVPFLYSIVKTLNKKVCLECGVSMGASSYAILKALDSQKEGKLISNDLPYLWIPNSIEKIGMLIPDELKTKWKLFIGDDKDNLPKIIKKYGKFDFAHYDSNKSYEARVLFCNLITDHLSNDATIIFDDIVDNDHFYDFCKTLDNSWKYFVLDDGSKFIGLLQKTNLTDNKY